MSGWSRDTAFGRSRLFSELSTGLPIPVRVSPAVASARRQLVPPISQTQWVIIAMLVGLALGYFFPDSQSMSGFHASDVQVLSNVFLRMIKSLIVPLLFATIVVGIAGHGDDMERVGTLALRSITYFEIVTTLALVIGLVMVNLVKPGLGVNLVSATADTGSELAKTKLSLTGILEHTVPQSFFDAAAKNEALQVTFFAIIFGVALSRVKGPGYTFLLSCCESSSEAMFKFVEIVMKFAPSHGFSPLAPRRRRPRCRSR